MSLDVNMSRDPFKTPLPRDFYENAFEEAKKQEPDNTNSSPDISHFDMINSAVLGSPMPGKHYSIFFESPLVEEEMEIPRIQFGEKEVNEEVVNVGLMINDALRMRSKYDHPFKFPWEKIERIEDEVKLLHEYDGTIQIEGQKNTGDVHSFKIHEGVFVVEEKGKGEEETNKIINKIGPKVSFEEYYEDYTILRNFSKYAPAKTYCFERYQFLRMKFDLYKAIFSADERVAMRRVPRRDFYNVRKVDNHVHLAACMNQETLLLFMRNKMKNCGNDVVMMEEGKPKTLREVCESVGLNHKNVSVDSLAVRASNETFHRFDRFVDIFNPFGRSQLRKVFLKVDNHMKGKYFAEVAKEVFAEYEKAKYILAEPRVSIYGLSKDELKNIAHWIHNSGLFSKNVRWIIQIPRLFHLHQKHNKVARFQDFLENIFKPFLHATIYPEEDPIVSNFLQNYLVGFDSVDDESKLEVTLRKKLQKPHLFGMGSTRGQNPHYFYYNYYFWANINVLNQLRRAKNMSTFAYRPHCGEAGDLRHLVSSYLLADSINHGIQLRLSPVMTYMYYLSQIGISISPLSNNYLFLDYQQSPFLDFFRAGINLALSTDDPLMFHNTREPLMEEYSICQQIMKLSNCDICEVARNSVLQSGWPHEYKQHWISRYYDQPGGVHSNNIKKTNVPNIRIQYRFETLLEEHLFIQSVLHQANAFKKKDQKSHTVTPFDDFQKLSAISRMDLVKVMKNLKENKIRLFTHEEQLNVLSRGEALEEHEKKVKEKKESAAPSNDEMLYFNFFAKKNKNVGEESEGESEDELGLEKQMKKDEQEISTLRNELYEIQKKMNELRRRRTAAKEKKKLLKNRFLNKYFVKKFKK